MIHSLELWASSHHRWPGFESTVSPEPGSINCPCVSYLSSMWSWPLVSNLLLHHPSSQLAFTLPELCSHMPWTTSPDSTGVCVLGSAPALILSHTPRDMLTGAQRCHWTAILNSSSVSTCARHQSSRECRECVGMASDRGSQADWVVRWP